MTFFWGYKYGRAAPGPLIRLYLSFFKKTKITVDKCAVPDVLDPAAPVRHPAKVSNEPHDSLQFPLHTHRQFRHLHLQLRSHQLLSRTLFIDSLLKHQPQKTAQIHNFSLLNKNFKTQRNSSNNNNNNNNNKHKPLLELVNMKISIAVHLGHVVLEGVGALGRQIPITRRVMRHMVQVKEDKQVNN